MTTKGAQEIANEWISTELNPLERKSLQQKLSSNDMAQHEKQSDGLQVTLQKVIDMIDMIDENSQELSKGVENP